jgi:GntR family transcriptional regulator/MocR family aminotransferase
MHRVELALYKGPFRTYDSRMPAPSASRRASRARAIAVLTSPERDGRPLYVQLHQQLREHILRGDLAPGSRLPSARTLASDLQVSRNTVEAAIGQLCAEGMVERRVGVGTIVANLGAVAPFARRMRLAAAGSPPPQKGAPARRRELSRRGERLAAGGQAELDADARTGPCMTDVEIFPARTWHQLLARVAREQDNGLLRTGDVQGDPSLRRAISEHARLTRGVRCTADEVVIVHSTQQALDLTSRLLLADGESVLMEEPGYRSARAVFTASGARVMGIPVDDDGLQAERLRLHRDARLLYLTPSHQYPLGVTLALRRRLETLAWARDAGAWIVEDDYDSEFRYTGRPIAAMQGLDDAERVLYLGTFNKVLFPGIRLAYLILPRALVSGFRAARRLTDGAPSPLVQAALARFLSEGHFAAHLRKARKLYEGRRNLLVERLEQRLGARGRVGMSQTGLHLVVLLPPELDDQSLADAGSGFGLGVEPLSSFYAGGREASSQPRGLLLGFGGASEAAIRRGVDAIARAMPAVTTDRRRA